MKFPVDLLAGVDPGALELSAKDCMSKLLYRSPAIQESLRLPDSNEIAIDLCSVSFVPLYGYDTEHKILGLYSREDIHTAVGLHLSGKWWSFEDILRTADPSRTGLLEVRTPVERIVLHVLNKFIYKAKEKASDEDPFLCHREYQIAKILWKDGEAIGFYSFIPEGTLCDSFVTQCYQLPVMDTVFVRKLHRGNGYGLQMLEDFVHSFRNESVGLKYPLPAAMYKVCRSYLSTHPADRQLLWEVRDVGAPYQRTLISKKLQTVELKEHHQFNRKLNFETEDTDVLKGRVISTPVQKTGVEYTVMEEEEEAQFKITKEVDDTPVTTLGRSGSLKRKMLGRDSEATAEKTIRMEAIEAAVRSPVHEAEAVRSARNLKETTITVNRGESKVVCVTVTCVHCGKHIEQTSESEEYVQEVSALPKPTAELSTLTTEETASLQMTSNITENQSVKSSEETQITESAEGSIGAADLQALEVQELVEVEIGKLTSEKATEETASLQMTSNVAESQSIKSSEETQVVKPGESSIGAAALQALEVQDLVEAVINKELTSGSGSQEVLKVGIKNAGGVKDGKDEGDDKISEKVICEVSSLQMSGQQTGLYLQPVTMGSENSSTTEMRTLRKSTAAASQQKSTYLHEELQVGSKPCPTKATKTVTKHKSTQRSFKAVLQDESRQTVDITANEVDQQLRNEVQMEEKLVEKVEDANEGLREKDLPSQDTALQDESIGIYGEKMIVEIVGISQVGAEVQKEIDSKMYLQEKGEESSVVSGVTSATEVEQRDTTQELLQPDHQAVPEETEESENMEIDQCGVDKNESSVNVGMSLERENTEQTRQEQELSEDTSIIQESKCEEIKEMVKRRDNNEEFKSDYTEPIEEPLKETQSHQEIQEIPDQLEREAIEDTSEPRHLHVGKVSEDWTESIEQEGSDKPGTSEKHGGSRRSNYSTPVRRSGRFRDQYVEGELTKIVLRSGTKLTTPISVQKQVRHTNIVKQQESKGTEKDFKEVEDSSEKETTEDVTKIIIVGIRDGGASKDEHQGRVAGSADTNQGIMEVTQEMETQTIEEIQGHLAGRVLRSGTKSVTAIQKQVQHTKTVKHQEKKSIQSEDTSQKESAEMETVDITNVEYSTNLQDPVEEGNKLEEEHLEMDVKEVGEGSENKTTGDVTEIAAVDFDVAEVMNESEKQVEGKTVLQSEVELIEKQEKEPASELAENEIVKEKTVQSQEDQDHDLAKLASTEKDVEESKDDEAEELKQTEALMELSEKNKKDGNVEAEIIHTVEEHELNKVSVTEEMDVSAAESLVELAKNEQKYGNDDISAEMMQFEEKDHLNKAIVGEEVDAFAEMGTKEPIVQTLEMQVEEVGADNLTRTDSGLEESISVEEEVKDDTVEHITLEEGSVTAELHTTERETKEVQESLTSNNEVTVQKISSEESTPVITRSLRQRTVTVQGSPQRKSKCVHKSEHVVMVEVTDKTDENRTEETEENKSEKMETKDGAKTKNQDQGGVPGSTDTDQVLMEVTQKQESLNETKIVQEVQGQESSHVYVGEKSDIWTESTEEQDSDKPSTSEKHGHSRKSKYSTPVRRSGRFKDQSVEGELTKIVLRSGTKLTTPISKHRQVRHTKTVKQQEKKRVQSEDESEQMVDVMESHTGGVEASDPQDRVVQHNELEKKCLELETISDSYLKEMETRIEDGSQDETTSKTSKVYRREDEEVPELDHGETVQENVPEEVTPVVTSTPQRSKSKHLQKTEMAWVTEKSKVSIAETDQSKDEKMEAEFSSRSHDEDRASGGQMEVVDEEAVVVSYTHQEIPTSESSQADETAVIDTYFAEGVKDAGHTAQEELPAGLVEEHHLEPVTEMEVGQGEQKDTEIVEKVIGAAAPSKLQKASVVLVDFNKTSSKQSAEISETSKETDSVPYEEIIQEPDEPASTSRYIEEKTSDEGMLKQTDLCVVQTEHKQADEEEVVEIAENENVAMEDATSKLSKGETSTGKVDSNDEKMETEEVQGKDLESIISIVQEIQGDTQEPRQVAEQEKSAPQTELAEVEHSIKRGKPHSARKTTERSAVLTPVRHSEQLTEQPTTSELTIRVLRSSKKQVQSTPNERTTGQTKELVLKDISSQAEDMAEEEAKKKLTELPTEIAMEDKVEPISVRTEATAVLQDIELRIEDSHSGDEMMEELSIRTELFPEQDKDTEVLQEAKEETTGKDSEKDISTDQELQGHTQKPEQVVEEEKSATQTELVEAEHSRKRGKAYSTRKTTDRSALGTPVRHSEQLTDQPTTSELSQRVLRSSTKQVQSTPNQRSTQQTKAMVLITKTVQAVVRAEEEDKDKPAEVSAELAKEDKIETVNITTIEHRKEESHPGDEEMEASDIRTELFPEQDKADEHTTEDVALKKATESTAEEEREKIPDLHDTHIEVDDEVEDRTAVESMAGTGKESEEAPVSAAEDVEGKKTESLVDPFEKSVGRSETYTETTQPLQKEEDELNKASVAEKEDAFADAGVVEPMAEALLEQAMHKPGAGKHTPIIERVEQKQSMQTEDTDNTLGENSLNEESIADVAKETVKVYTSDILEVLEPDHVETAQKIAPEEVTPVVTSRSLRRRTVMVTSTPQRSKSKHLQKTEMAWVTEKSKASIAETDQSKDEKMEAEFSSRSHDEDRASGGQMEVVDEEAVVVSYTHQEIPTSESSQADETAVTDTYFAEGVKDAGHTAQEELPAGLVEEHHLEPVTEMEVGQGEQKDTEIVEKVIGAAAPSKLQKASVVLVDFNKTSSKQSAEISETSKETDSVPYEEIIQEPDEPASTSRYIEEKTSDEGMLKQTDLCVVQTEHKQADEEEVVEIAENENVAMEDATSKLSKGETSTGKVDSNDEKMETEEVQGKDLESIISIVQEIQGDTQEPRQVAEQEKSAPQTELAEVEHSIKRGKPHSARKTTERSAVLTPVRHSEQLTEQPTTSELTIRVLRSSKKQVQSTPNERTTGQTKELVPEGKSVQTVDMAEKEKEKCTEVPTEPPMEDKVEPISVLTEGTAVLQDIELRIEDSHSGDEEMEELSIRTELFPEQDKDTEVLQEAKEETTGKDSEKDISTDQELQGHTQKPEQVVEEEKSATQIELVEAEHSRKRGKAYSTRKTTDRSALGTPVRHSEQLTDQPTTSELSQRVLRSSTKQVQSTPNQRSTQQTKAMVLITKTVQAVVRAEEEDKDKPAEVSAELAKEDKIETVNITTIEHRKEESHPGDEEMEASDIRTELFPEQDKADELTTEDVALKKATESTAEEEREKIPDLHDTHIEVDDEVEDRTAVESMADTGKESEEAPVSAAGSTSVFTVQKATVVLVDFKKVTPKQTSGIQATEESQKQDEQDQASRTEDSTKAMLELEEQHVLNKADALEEQLKLVETITETLEQTSVKVGEDTIINTDSGPGEQEKGKLTEGVILEDESADTEAVRMVEVCTSTTEASQKENQDSSTPDHSRNVLENSPEEETPIILSRSLRKRIVTVSSSPQRKTKRLSKHGVDNVELDKTVDNVNVAEKETMEAEMPEETVEKDKEVGNKALISEDILLEIPEDSSDEDELIITKNLRQRFITVQSPMRRKSKRHNIVETRTETAQPVAEETALLVEVSSQREASTSVGIQITETPTDSRDSSEDQAESIGEVMSKGVTTSEKQVSKNIPVIVVETEGTQNTGSIGMVEGAPEDNIEHRTAERTISEKVQVKDLTDTSLQEKLPDATLEQESGKQPQQEQKVLNQAEELLIEKSSEGMSRRRVVGKEEEGKQLTEKVYIGNVSTTEEEFHEYEEGAGDGRRLLRKRTITTTKRTKATTERKSKRMCKLSDVEHAGSALSVEEQATEQSIIELTAEKEKEKETTDQTKQKNVEDIDNDGGGVLSEKAKDRENPEDEETCGETNISTSVGKETTEVMSISVEESSTKIEIKKGEKREEKDGITITETVEEIKELNEKNPVEYSEITLAPDERFVLQLEEEDENNGPKETSVNEEMEVSLMGSPSIQTKAKCEEHITPETEVEKVGKGAAVKSKRVPKGRSSATASLQQISPRQSRQFLQESELEGKSETIREKAEKDVTEEQLKRKAIADTPRRSKRLATPKSV